MVRMAVTWELPMECGIFFPHIASQLSSKSSECGSFFPQLISQLSSQVFRMWYFLPTPHTPDLVQVNLSTTPENLPVPPSGQPSS